MQTEDKILLIHEVEAKVRLHNATIWRYQQVGKFPMPDLKIGRAKRGWYESTINKWIKEQEVTSKGIKKYASN